MKSIYRRILLIALCVSLLGIRPTARLHADTTIATSQTQTGGTLTVAPPTLLITHPTNNPLLTLTNGATTSVVNAVIVGNLNGDEGQLLINNGSSITTVTGTSVGTYGNTSISSGSSYLGLNTGSTGTATVSGANSTWTNGWALRIGNSGTGTLSILDGGSVNNHNSTIGYSSGSNGTVTVSGANSRWTNSSGLEIGFFGTAMLSILNGGYVSSLSGNIGSLSFNSTVIVSGANSTWTNVTEITVGLLGNGSLLIQNGGNVSNAQGFIGNGSGSTGTVTVSGLNSTWTNNSWLEIGRNGTGTMSILDGGRVVSNKSWSYIGASSGSNGMVTVSGANSTWISGLLHVGSVGTGALSVENGGSMSSTSSQIGASSGSNGTVTIKGVNSTWISGLLHVGSVGTGALSVENGGSMSSTSSQIGASSGSNGTVTIKGVNSTWTNAGQISIGVSGTGTLTIQNGGSVRSGFGYIGFNSRGTLSIQDGGSLSNTNGFIGFNSGSTGTATISGANSTWTNSQSLYIGGSATLSGGIGTLTINNGGKVTVANTTKIWFSDTLNLNGGTLETDILEAANSTSRIVLTGNNNQIRIGSNSTFVGGIQGNGGFIKTGPGTLTLNNTNTFTGTIFVTEGMLNVQTSLPNNGPTSVSIPSPDNSLDGNPSLSRRRNINASYAGFGATSSGSLNTTLEIRAGTNLTGTDNSVIMQVRQRTLAEAQTSLFSDVFNLTGMVNNPGVNPDQTDLFVLQMSYDPALIPDELQAARNGDLILGVLNESTGQWVNAVSTNIGGTPMFVGDTPWNSSYMTLGQYGVDTNANTVWAVINHNSQFAVVPEPSTWVAGSLAMLGFSAVAIRRRRAR